ncbi:hypothetical protein PHYPO_G00073620 [Pangasianodon hypophthalmus]|uniref:Uncharacterized protein n=1 Tax=Pangasianodon hypophthalmus TaxID=310915 RepID=A0A5N5LUX1_PANHP|nr:hypothetical protein PHYPO_G00073620 [Pangasianodon hypophthalmus]
MAFSRRCLHFRSAQVHRLSAFEPFALKADVLSLHGDGLESSVMVQVQRHGGKQVYNSLNSNYWRRNIFY